MPPTKPYVVGPARGAPYPAPAINLPNLIKQVENLTQRVQALEAVLGYQNLDVSTNSRSAMGAFSRMSVALRLRSPVGSRCRWDAYRTAGAHGDALSRGRGGAG